MSSPARRIARNADKVRDKRDDEWTRYVEAFVDLHGVQGAMERVWAAGSPSHGHRNNHTWWVQWAARRQVQRERGTLRSPIRPHMVSVWANRVAQADDGTREAA